MFKSIRYVVIAVQDAVETAAFYTKTYGLAAKPPDDIPATSVRRVLVDVGNAWIELVQPLRDDMPVAKFLRERGEGLYMLAVEVDDPEKAIVELRARGAKVTDAGMPAGGPPIRAYIHPKSAHGVLIAILSDAVAAATASGPSPGNPPPRS
ncbi:MAG: hypothetical protein EXR49_07735 [Dehalococcoidia bacterium]|nr:hypothetical protein [Dehalococcoidia bacterium]